MVTNPSSGPRTLKPSATTPISMLAAASRPTSSGTQWWEWGATAIWKLASAVHQRFERQHEEQHRAGTALVSAWHEGSK